MYRRNFIAGLTLGSPVLTALAADEVWPSRPVTIVVGYPAGGLSDIVARLAARHLENEFKQPFIVENRAGANSLVATQSVLKSSPDGYTLLMTQNALLTNTILLPNPSYDGVRDFSPVARLYETSVVLAVPPSGISGFSDFVLKARQMPGGLSMGTVGHGSTSHYYGELLARASGIKLNNVGYKGDTLMLPDLMAGRLDCGMISSGSAMTFGREGKVALVGVTGRRRWRVLPDVPTFSELGIQGLHADGFSGLFAPKGTPPSIVAKINDAVGELTRSQDFSKQLLSVGLEAPPPLSPDEFKALVQSIHSEWIEIRKSSAIRLE